MELLRDLSQIRTELEKIFSNNTSVQDQALNQEGLSICMGVSALCAWTDQLTAETERLLKQIKDYEAKRRALGETRLCSRQETQCTICTHTFPITDDQPIGLYCEVTIGDHRQHLLHQVCTTCFKEKAHRSENHVRYFLAQPTFSNGHYRIRPIEDENAPWQILTEVTPIPKKTVLRTDTAELLGLPPEIDFNPKPLINRPFLRLGLKLFEV